MLEFKDLTQDDLHSLENHVMAGLDKYRLKFATLDTLFQCQQQVDENFNHWVNEYFVLLDRNLPSFRPICRFIHDSIQIIFEEEEEEL